MEESEIRVAFLEDEQLVDLFLEKTDDLSIVGNLYKGIVEDVVPGLKASFIDIGLERRAFLHFNDFIPEALNPAGRKKSLFRRLISKETGEDREKKENRSRPSPASTNPVKILHKGQAVLVQVIKDEIGRKGPRVTANIALPGRKLVLLPHPSQRGGVSRKIANFKERQRLRKILGSIKTAQRSFIIRTAGKGMSDDAIKSDIGHLKRIWSNILRKYRGKNTPLLLFNDHDILYRIVRDHFTEDLDEIMVDNIRVFKKIKKLLHQMIPRLADRVKFFSKPESLFHHYHVEKQIQKATRRKVWLKSGGYVVFDETEALTAIDVNSGRYIGKKDQEKTVLKTNLEACQVIAQQLRLRDIGGIIVIDFIDMVRKENRETVERTIHRCLRPDRAKHTILPISEFGLVELTRKRVRQSLKHRLFTKCPYCEGSGRVLAPNQIWRQIKYSLLELLQQKPRPGEITVMIHPRTKRHIQEKLQGALDQVVKKYSVPVSLLSSEDLHIEDFQVRYTLPGRSEIWPRRQEN